MVLEIKGSLAVADAKWSFFQALLIVEDALGLKFPVPSECDYDLLNAITKHRFQDGLGALDVRAGNYELFNTKNSKQVLSTTVRALPGSTIMMAILVSKSILSNETCPMWQCRSKKTRDVPGGGRLVSVFHSVGIWDSVLTYMAKL